jgi:hypothetical protein
MAIISSEASVDRDREAVTLKAKSTNRDSSVGNAATDRETAEAN